MKQRISFLSLVLSSLRNRPGRNIATIFCFAFIAANIFSAQYLLAGASGSVDQGLSRMGADILVVPDKYQAYFQDLGPENAVATLKVEPSIFRFGSGTLDTIRGIRGVAKASPQVYIATLKLPEISAVPIDIIGIDPSSDITIQPWLHRPLAHPLGDAEVLVGNDIAGEAGSTLTVHGKTYTIAGRLDPAQHQIDHTLFMGLDDAYALAAVDGVVPANAPKISPGEYNAVLVQTDSSTKPEVVGSRVQAVIPHVISFRKQFATAPVNNDVQGLPVLLNSIAAIVVLASLPLIALISAMVTHERQHEIGILKSLGATKKAIFSLVIAESLSLAVVGGIAGAGISFGVLSLLNTEGVMNGMLQMSFNVPAPGQIAFMTILALGIVIAIGSVASLYPAYKSTTMNPYDAIREER